MPLTIGIQLLSVLVPVLIEFLLPDANFKAINHHAKLLHEISLQWLMKIGPQYPQVRNIFDHNLSLDGAAFH